ncbi:MAG: DUF4418 family protein [Blautia sp.]|nr:DUF4418 family protein [Blautia sp.]
MKKKVPVPALAILILATLVVAGVKTVLGPCVHEDGSFGPCHWTGQAVFGTAVLLAVQSLCAIVQRQEAGRRGLYLAMMLTAVLGILFPGTLIGLCGMATMRCRAVMRPAVTILFSLAAILSLAGFLTGRTSRMDTGA